MNLMFSTPESPFRRAYWGLATSVSTGLMAFALNLHAIIAPMSVFEGRFLAVLALAVLQFSSAIYAIVVAVRGRRMRGSGGVAVIAVSGLCVVFSAVSPLFHFFVNALARF